MTDTTLAERLARCVKPLEWTLDHRGDWWAHPYRIRRIEGFCIVSGWVSGTNPYDTLEAAQAAAQADFAARILAALDMDALAQEVEAMVGAAVEADRAEFQCGECDLPSYLCEARCFVRNAIKVHGEEKTWESVKEYFPAIRAREGGKP
jgi:hypothetical protein